ncbi:MAG: hypothetical protein IPK99_17500 [Flavobacteriales bacterium]|nr:hypothetical protein [Flavobacteriales bacterium]
MCRSIAITLLLSATVSIAQQDGILPVIVLDEFVVRAQADGFDIPTFIQLVKEDTTFHHAFLNMRVHPHRTVGTLRVRDVRERGTAEMYRDAHLVRMGAYAELIVDSAYERGKLRNAKGGHRFLTAELFEDLFFPSGQRIANSTIPDHLVEGDATSRIERYKNELKRFMFNPGQELARVPWIGDKLALFEPRMAAFYDYKLWSNPRNGHACWVFSADAKAGSDEDDTVIKHMDTWFDQATGQVIAREYRIAHNSLLLGFDISIQADLDVEEGLLVPTHVTYDGVWDIPLQRKERVRFHLRNSAWQNVMP